MSAFFKGGVTFLTGAGVSTDSGLPDFRGREGLWTDGDLATLLTAAGPRDHFDQFTRFCKAAIREIQTHKPNMTHHAIAQLQKSGLVDSVITQNVDGYHQEAGSTHVIEAHGNIRNIACMNCGTRCQLAFYMQDGGEICADCGGQRRPQIVLFDERLTERVLVSYLAEITTTKLLVCVGTTLTVAPVALAPEIVRKNGGKVCVINGEPSEQDDLANFIFHDRLDVMMRELYMWVKKFDHLRHDMPEYQELEIASY
jgi:NAD-dependent deacetylase